MWADSVAKKDRLSEGSASQYFTIDRSSTARGRPVRGRRVECPFLGGRASVCQGSADLGVAQGHEGSCTLFLNGEPSVKPDSLLTASSYSKYFFISRFVVFFFISVRFFKYFYPCSMEYKRRVL